MKIISIRAPWWWWILHGGKDIENRDWKSDYRGPLIIHASSYWSLNDVRGDWESGCDMWKKQPVNPEGVCGTHPGREDHVKSMGGHIVGVTDMVDCVDSSRSPWFVGKYGFVLQSPRPLAKPIPFKARLGLIEAPPEIVSGVGQ